MEKDTEQNGLTSEVTVGLEGESDGDSVNTDLPDTPLQFPGAAEKKQPYDMQLAIHDGRVCSNCYTKGPAEGPLMLMVNIPQPPSQIMIGNRPPAPPKQAAMQACFCANPKSPRYMQIISLQCSCEFFTDIPEGVQEEVPKEKKVAPTLKIGRKLKS